MSKQVDLDLTKIRQVTDDLVAIETNRHQEAAATMLLSLDDPATKELSAHRR